MNNLSKKTTTIAIMGIALTFGLKVHAKPTAPGQPARPRFVMREMPDADTLDAHRFFQQAPQDRFRRSVRYPTFLSGPYTRASLRGTWR